MKINNVCDIRIDKNGNTYRQSFLEQLKEAGNDETGWVNLDLSELEFGKDILTILEEALGE